MSDVEDRLSVNRYVIDVHSHIEADAEVCEKCRARYCITVCPAACYSEEEGRLTVAYEGCLECGTCLQVCQNGAVRWKYPRGGFGVAFRYS